MRAYIKSLFLLLFIIGVNVTDSFSCDCLWGGSFMKVTKETPFVALVKVTEYSVFRQSRSFTVVPIAMAVEVIDIYRGSETRKRVLVWGNGGSQCKADISGFKVGQYYVIGFFSVDKGYTHMCEEDTDYSINGCGSYWLKVSLKAKNAIGDINSDDRTESTMSLDKLKNIAGFRRNVIVKAGTNRPVSVCFY
jgi:hypothetical protein